MNCQQSSRRHFLGSWCDQEETSRTSQRLTVFGSRNQSVNCTIRHPPGRRQTFGWRAVADPLAGGRRKPPTSHPSTSWTRLGGRLGATSVPPRLTKALARALGHTHSHRSRQRCETMEVAPRQRLKSRPYTSHGPQAHSIATDRSGATRIEYDSVIFPGVQIYQSRTLSEAHGRQT